MKLTKESVEKMSAEEIKKVALELVDAQDTLEKAVGEFEGKVKKAVADNKAAVDAIAKSRANITNLAKEAIVQITQAAGGVAAPQTGVTGLKPEEVDTPTHKCMAKDCKGLMIKAESEDASCPKCGGKMEKVAPAPAKVAPKEELADDAPVKVLTEKVEALTKGIKERDDVITDLTGLVDTLQKSIITKADVDDMLKEGLAAFRKSIK